MKRTPPTSSPARPSSRAGGPTANGGPARAGAGAGSALTDRIAALGEFVRLRILRLLEREELSVGEVAKVVQMPQSTVSRHLKVLTGGGWLTRRMEGTATYYRLLPDDLPADVRNLWNAVRAQMHDSAQLREDARRLDAVLADRRTDSLAYFGRVAGEWDDVRQDLFGRGFTAHALTALLPPNWTVADLGCGTGNAAEHLAPFVGRVIAVDASAPMLKAAKKRLAGFDNVEFRRGDLNDLPLDDASVNAAVCVLVLHHMPEPVKAVAEMARILRPGGAALIVDMHEHDRAEYRHTMGHAHQGFSDDFIGEAMTAAGLADVRVRPLPSNPDSRGPGLFIATGRKPA